MLFQQFNFIFLNMVLFHNVPFALSQSHVPSSSQQANLLANGERLCVSLTEELFQNINAAGRCPSFRLDIRPLPLSLCWRSNLWWICEDYG